MNTLTLRTIMCVAILMILHGIATMASGQERKTTRADCRRAATPETIFLDLSENSTQAFATKYLSCGMWEFQAIESADSSRPVAWSPFDREVCGKDSCNCTYGYTASFHIFFTNYPDVGNGVKLFMSNPKLCRDPRDVIKKAKPHRFRLEKNAMVTFWLTTAYLRKPYDIRGGGLTISIKKIL